MHEITHQWGTFAGSELGLSDGSGHYSSFASTASPLGGFEWIDNKDGTHTLNCEEGRDGGYHAPPIDKYLMGLIPGEDVPTLHVNNDIAILGDCGSAVVSAQDVTIEDIQKVYGVRTPGPQDAQRSFRIAFVVESYNRLLNPTELTYYETLAEHFTRPIPPEEPDPYMWHNWPSMDRFFGEGTTWSTVIPVYFDVDANGQVDDTDYAAYAACHTGPAGAFENSCKIFDRDKNAHVDLREFARFQVAFTGTAPSP